MRQRQAKSNIIYVYLITWSQQISLEHPQGGLCCACVLLCLRMSQCMWACTFGVLACDHIDMLLRALDLYSRVCSIIAPTHACLAGLVGLPQAAHPFIFIFLTPADKSSQCALKLPVRAPIQGIHFSQGWKLETKKHKKTLSSPPKSRAVKKTKLMIGCKWRRGGGVKRKGQGRKIHLDNNKSQNG